VAAMRSTEQQAFTAPRGSRWATGCCTAPTPSGCAPCSPGAACPSPAAGCSPGGSVAFAVRS
jgi:hypothetical protein